MTIANLNINLGLDLSDVQKAADKVSKALDPVRKKLDGLGKGLSTYVTAPALAAVGALSGLATKAAKYADEIDKAAIRTGLSTDRLQELRFVTDQVGTSFSTVEKATQGLSRRLLSADEDGSKVQQTMASIGVSVRDASGEFKSMDELFPDVIDKLSKIENESERAALATQIFGGAAHDLKPLIAAGSDEIERLSDRARQMGLVMGPDSLNKLVAFQDQLGEIKSQAAAATREIGAAFVPILTDYLLPAIQATLIPALRKLAGFIEALVTWFQELSTPLKIVTGLFVSFAILLGPALIAVAKLIGLGKALIAVFVGLSKAKVILVAKVVAIIAIFAALIAVGEVLRRNSDLIRDKFGSMWDEMKIKAADSLLGITRAISGFTSRFGVSFDGVEDKLLDFKEAAEKSLAGRETTTWAGVWDGITSTVRAGIDRVKEGFDTARERLSVFGEEVVVTGNRTGEAVDDMAAAYDRLHAKMRRAMGGDYIDAFVERHAEKNLGMLANRIASRRINSPADTKAFRKADVSRDMVEQMRNSAANRGANREILGTEQMQRAAEMARTVSASVSASINETTKAATFGSRYLADVYNNLIEATYSMAYAIKYGMEDAASGFLEGIGKMLDGSGDFDDVLNGVLTTLADMAIRVGRIAIGIGVSVGAIQKALKSLNPVAAIAAGAALVTLGTWAKSSLAAAADRKQQTVRRAFGGPVRPNEDIIVGEKGPEVLRLGQSTAGYVFPNSNNGRSAPRQVIENKIYLDGRELRKGLVRSEHIDQRLGVF